MNIYPNIKSLLLVMVLACLMGCEPGKLPEPEAYTGNSKVIILEAGTAMLSTICEDVPLELDASQPDALGYAWSTGDSTSSITPSDSGIYSVTVSTPGGPLTASAVVDFAKTPLPFNNFFSPDGGGYNDRYSISSDCVYSLSLRILSSQNEWQTVFETTDKDFEWDGKNKRGKTVPSGSYQVVYKAFLYSGERLEGSYWLEIVY